MNEIIDQLLEKNTIVGYQVSSDSTSYSVTFVVKEGSYKH